MRQNYFNIISNPADTSGCCHYRMRTPYMGLQSVTRDIRVTDSMKVVVDPKFYRDVRVVRMQRQVSDAQAAFYTKFLKPLSDQIGFWLIYEIDDVISYDDIPPYNIGRHAFKNDNFYKNIQSMMLASDFITITTDELKTYYVNKYKIPEEKFLVIPNYLPRWWAGESYNLNDIVTRYNKNKNKPRIGFPVSSSHFDLEGNNNYIDDFTHIIDFIIKNVNKYQFVFMGGYPKQLAHLIKNKKIEYHRSSDILNYPRELYAKDLQCIIAPLQDNTFNRCKSNIKLLEGWALGIPVVAQNLSCYNKYTDYVFNNSSDIEGVINKILSDKNKFKSIVKKNRAIVDYGDKNSPNGWWLEKNLYKWRNIFAIPQKTIEYDLTEVTEKEGTIEL